MILICPICSYELIVNVQGVSCINKHQYDRAKEGYYNLLPVQFKHSREPGDAKEQLQARRTFLSAGFFSPLSQRLNQLISQDAKNILDIGCGEGYFTHAMAGEHVHASVLGIDIAKAGVRMAAKNAAANITYAVASSYSLPVANNSIDVAVRVYAPSKDEELHRVIKPHGHLIVVTPGESHLIGLRQKIYREIKPHPEPKTIMGFTLCEQSLLAFDLELPPGELTRAMLQMTPFAWRINQNISQQLIAEGLVDQASFHISLYVADLLD